MSCVQHPIDFTDARAFTFVMFHAMTYVGCPRVFDAAEAITGKRPELEKQNAYFSGTGPRAVSLQDLYVLPDNRLRAYDHGLGTLTVDGELKGYLASIVGEIRFPSRGLWPWFVVVWLDGTKERSFEDYGPRWLTVRELDAGRLDHFERSVPRESRFLWMRPRCVFEFEWLPAGVAAHGWKEIGLVDADF